MRPLLLAPFLALAALFAGCPSVPSTPEAIAFDTLQQAQNFIKAKHDLFDIEVAAGKVPSTEEQIKVHKAYVEAQTAIRVAAETASLGLNASTPAEVDRLVATFIRLVGVFLPPEPHP